MLAAFVFYPDITCASTNCYNEKSPKTKLDYSVLDNCTHCTQSQYRRAVLHTATEHIPLPWKTSMCLLKTRHFRPSPHPPVPLADQRGGAGNPAMVPLGSARAIAVWHQCQKTLFHMPGNAVCRFQMSPHRLVAGDQPRTLLGDLLCSPRPRDWWRGGTDLLP